MHPTRITPVMDGSSSSRPGYGGNGSGGLVESIYNEGSPSRFFEPVKGALFGLMYVLSGSAQSSTSAMILTALVEALQLSNYAIRPSSFPSWNLQLVSPLASIYSALNLSFVFTSATFWVSIISVMSLVALTFIVSAVVGHAVYSRRSTFTSTFWVIRFLLKGFSGVLFLPIVDNLLKVFACGKDGKHLVDDKIQCWTGFHIVLSSFAALILLIFVILVILVKLMSNSRDPRSRCFNACCSGRPLVVLLLVKVAIVLVFLTSDSQNVLVGLVCISSLSFVSIVLFFLPFHNHITNRAYTVFYSLYMWASLCTAISVIIGDSQDKASFLVYLVPMPLLLYSTVSICDWRLMTLASLPIVQVSSPWLVAPHIRMLVTEDHVKNDELERALDGAMAQFPRSPIVILFAIACWDSFKRERKTKELVRECQMLDLAIDQAFELFRLNREDEERSRGSDVSTASTLDALSLLKVEHHEMEMEKAMFECHCVVLQFWEEISQPVLNSSLCSSLSSDIDAFARVANDNFQAILRLQPSPNSIRRFAGFLSNTLNNKWKGDELLERANAIEDEQLKKKRELLEALTNTDARKGVVLSLEAVAMAGDVCAIALSSQDHNIGTILEAGRLLTSILGYEPEAVIGTNINFIMPEPIASMHDGLLRKYVASGKGSFMGKTRLVPALHANGYLVNILLTLFDKPEEQKFVGLVRSAPAQGEFAIADDSGKVTCSTSHFPLGTVQANETSEYSLTMAIGENWRDPSSTVDVSGEAYSVKTTKMQTMHMDAPIFLVAMEPLLRGDSDTGSHKSMSSRKLAKVSSNRLPSVADKHDDAAEEEEETNEDHTKELDVFSVSDGSNSSDTFSDVMRHLHATASVFNKAGSHDAIFPIERIIKLSFLVVIVATVVSFTLPNLYAEIVLNHFRQQTLFGLRQSGIGDVFLASRGLKISLDSDVIASRDDLLQKANRLTSIENSIHFDPDLSPTALEFSIKPSLKLSEADGSKTFTSLWSGVKKFALQALLAAQFDESDPQVSDSSRAAWNEQLEFVHLNGGDSLFYAAREASSRYRSAEENADSNVMRPATLVTALLSIVILTTLTIWMTRVTWSVQEHNDAVFAVLKDIPHKQLLQVIDHYQVGMQSLIEFSSSVSSRPGGSDNSAPSRRRRRRKARPEASLNIFQRFVKTVASRFNKSVLKLCLILLQLSSALVVAVAFQGVVMDTYFHIYQHNVMDQQRLYYTHQILPGMQRFFYGVREIAMNGGDPTVYRPMVNEQLLEVKFDLNAVLFGNNSYPFPHYEVDKPSDFEGYPGVGNLLFSDGCASLSGDNKAYQACSEFSFGTMKNGLYPALLLLQDSAARIVAGGNSALNEKDYKTFEELCLVYVFPIFGDYVRNLESALRVNIETILYDLKVAFGVSMFLAIVLYFSVYRRVIRQVASLLQHNEALPLLLPFHIVRECKQVREFLMGMSS